MLLNPLTKMTEEASVGFMSDCPREVGRDADRLGAVLLDAHLGGIDVVRLFQAFRIAAPEMLVVIASGSQEGEIEKMFKGRSYSGFLSKSFTLAELKSVLCSVVRS